ncbi:hypothetical protein Pelo_9722 [Pelomyxa schiedti]|nr:hypothetical protein Pelo_9722 [Pelomyxa schiedti]
MSATNSRVPTPPSQQPPPSQTTSSTPPAQASSTTSADTNSRPSTASHNHQAPPQNAATPSPPPTAPAAAATAVPLSKEQLPQLGLSSSSSSPPPLRLPQSVILTTSSPLAQSSNPIIASSTHHHQHNVSNTNNNGGDSDHHHHHSRHVSTMERAGVAIGSLVAEIDSPDIVSKPNGEKSSPRDKVKKVVAAHQTKGAPAVILKQFNMNKITVKTPREQTALAAKDALYYLEQTMAQAQNVNSMAPDPASIKPILEQEHYLANLHHTKKKSSVDKKVWILLPLVMCASWVVLLLCFGVDRFTQLWKIPHASDEVDDVISHYDYSFSAFIYTLLNPTPNQARALLQAVTNTMAFLFGLLVSIIGIILQFASDKITSHVTSLFFRDKLVLAAITFVLIGNAFSMWVYLELGDYHSPRSAVVLTVLLVNIQLVMLFPFLAYLFFFLDAEEVVTIIKDNGLSAVKKALTSQLGNRTVNEKSQLETTLSIEYLMDSAVASIKKKNKNVSSQIVDALESFCVEYIQMKNQAPEEWFKMPLWLKQSPDFLILEKSSLKEIKKRKLWVEWKVLRQYQTLFSEALRWFKELCYHLCINTRLIGEAAAKKNEYNVLDLSIKFFNTFLRASINLNEARVVYNSLFQYRQLAEALLDKKSGGANPTLTPRAVKIAKFLRYYASLCHNKRLFFLVETVAHDLRVLCEVATKSIPSENGTGPDPFYKEVHNKLLEVLLPLCSLFLRNQKGVSEPWRLCQQ